MTLMSISTMKILIWITTMREANILMESSTTRPKNRKRRRRRKTKYMVLLKILYVQNIFNTKGKLYY